MAISISDDNALIGVDIAGYLTTGMSQRALNLHPSPDDQMRLQATPVRSERANDDAKSDRGKGWDNISLARPRFDQTDSVGNPNSSVIRWLTGSHSRNLELSGAR
jgi:hypothetical protein